MVKMPGWLKGSKFDASEYLKDKKVDQCQQ